MKMIQQHVKLFVTKLCKVGIITDYRVTCKEVGLPQTVPNLAVLSEIPAPVTSKGKFIQIWILGG